MKNENPFLSGILGTSLMTLYSYSVSESKHNNFKEPKLLAELVEKIIKKKDLSTLSGWAMHYAMGVILATALETYWQKQHIKPGINQSLIAGIATGIFGIATWKMIFSIHPNPPKTPYRRYYKHLMLAHLVFSAGVALARSCGGKPTVSSFASEPFGNQRPKTKP